MEAVRQIDHPVADVLRVLAVSRSSGALEIRGVRGGTFFLHEGDITYAEVLGLPPAELFDTDDPQLPSTIQSSIVEAGLTLLAEENAGGDRPLFRPGRRHWSGGMCRLQVDEFLSEIAKQLACFADLGVEPDDQVQLCRLESGRMVVLSRQQWALAAQMCGSQTARSLARRSGMPLGVTIETVASMVGAGIVQRGSPSVAKLLVPDPVPQPARMSPARESSVRKTFLREPSGREPGSPQARLPQRVRGVTPRSADRSELRPRMPPRQDDDEAADARALALRLLEGLRRL